MKLYIPCFFEKEDLNIVRSLGDPGKDPRWGLTVFSKQFAQSSRSLVLSTITNPVIVIITSSDTVWPIMNSHKVSYIYICTDGSPPNPTSNTMMHQNTLFRGVSYTWKECY